MKLNQFIRRSPLVPILLAGRRLETRLSANFSDEGCTVWEALILVSVLFEERACRPSEISAALGLSRSHFSQILKRLVADGLLKREISPLSARSIDLLLTARGKKTALKAVKIFDAVVNEIENRIGVTAAEAMPAALLKI